MSEQYKNVSNSLSNKQF